MEIHIQKSDNMANFEVFRQVMSPSITFLFLKNVDFYFRYRLYRQKELLKDYIQILDHSKRNLFKKNVFFFQFNFLKLTNEVRQVIQTKLVLACGEDSLYCDIADMEAVCSDILDDNNGNGSSSSLEEDLPDNHHLRQKRQAQIKSRHQKQIQIFFNMLGKAS